VTKILNI